jgi:hypothetical protein
MVAWSERVVRRARTQEALYVITTSKGQVFVLRAPSAAAAANRFSTERAGLEISHILEAELIV